MSINASILAGSLFCFDTCLVNIPVVFYLQSYNAQFCATVLFSFLFHGICDSLKIAYIKLNKEVKENKSLAMTGVAHLVGHHSSR